MRTRDNGGVDSDRGANSTCYTGDLGESKESKTRICGLPVLYRRVSTIELGMGPGRPTGVLLPVSNHLEAFIRPLVKLYVISP